jgi:hypothetical protein
LRLAGTFRVVRDSIELTDGQIGSRKSRTLLKLLAVERPTLVPVDRIVDVLWPTGRPAAPEQNVATCEGWLPGARPRTTMPWRRVWTGSSSPISASAISAA